MIDILKLYPNAVEVDPKSITQGAHVALLSPSESVEALYIFEVADQNTSQMYFTASDGGTYRYRGWTAYVIPPKLPTEPGSIIRNVVTTGGPDPYVSGTLLSDGRWYLVDVSGIAGPLGAHHIASFEVV